MTTLDAIFDHRLDFDPAAGDVDAFARQAPAKWVVYLFTDAADQPVQLLCVKNLRASIKRRLGGDELVGLSRKVNYRDLVRRIYWRRVDSAFEADLLYLDIARHIFPASYRGMLGFEPAWFLHVNVDAKFPRYVKTTELDKQGALVGPLEDKHAAARLIQLTEDAFDLCRYYNILLESPDGRACAYKEMGKCPAPCDGTISLTQYRELVRWSAKTIVDPGEYVRAQTRRMEAAAQDLHFEAAGKIKQYVDQISQFGKGPFRHARNFEDFRYLSLQHGPRPGTAKVFLVSPGGVEESAACLADATKNTDFLRYLLDRSASLSPDRDQRGVEAVGVVADHLFRARKTGGVFLHVDDLEERAFAKAWRELQKQKAPDESDDEGVVKELQQI